MLQIYVTLWGRWCVCVRERERVCLELLSHFLPIKINLTNILPILIKMVDFKNLAWATSFATRASRKFIYLPYRASGEKSYCHYPSAAGDVHASQARDRKLNGPACSPSPPPPPAAPPQPQQPPPATPPQPAAAVQQSGLLRHRGLLAALLLCPRYQLHGVTHPVDPYRP